MSAIPGVVGALFVLAIATWWLSNVALQVQLSFANVPATSLQAAGIAVLGQWMLVALVTRPGHGDNALRDGLASALLAIVPLWPLLALLWQTSKLSALTLALSQVIAVAIAVLVLAVATLLSRTSIALANRQLYRMAASMVLATAIWLLRGPILDWLRL